MISKISLAADIDLKIEVVYSSSSEGSARRIRPCEGHSKWLCGVCYLARDCNGLATAREHLSLINHDSRRAIERAIETHQSPTLIVPRQAVPGALSGQIGCRVREICFDHCGAGRMTGALLK